MAVCFYRCSRLNWNHPAAPAPSGRSGARSRMQRGSGMQHLPACTRVHTLHPSPPSCFRTTLETLPRTFSFLEDVAFDKRLSWVSFLGCLFGTESQKKSKVERELFCGMGRRMEEDGATAPFIFLFFIPPFDCRDKAGCSSTPCVM